MITDNKGRPQHVYIDGGDEKLRHQMEDAMTFLKETNPSHVPYREAAIFTGSLFGGAYAAMKGYQLLIRISLRR